MSDLDAGLDAGLDADLLARARAWAAGDPDPGDAAALTALLERAASGDGAAAAEVADAFRGSLAFGTAGLRGVMGPGPNRMNRAVVVRAAAGLAMHLLAAVGAAPTGSTPAARTPAARTPTGSTPATSTPGSSTVPQPRPPSVVLGYDARHRSADLARESAAVIAGAGLRALLLPRALPTPVLAFAVRHLGADAGVMVTASHNPAADNGYKVYLGGADGGSQIVPPADAQIAARIAAVGDLADVPRDPDGAQVLGEDVLEAYLTAASGTAGPAPGDGRRSRLRVVLTPMHGVGGAVALEALARAGVDDVTVVPEQAEPDPDFPTVAFPNPEEPGALDAALALAAARGADLVIAVDPDADRCAVAVADPEGPEATGGWRALTGDELGAVLAEQVASRPLPGDAVLACSLVSSRLLGAIARAHGVRWAQTLTGFKWISRVPGLVFGYEEAIGYCLAPDLVRDKDGISAAVAVSALAADLAAEGRTLLDVLDDLARSHGVHATGQVSFRVADTALIEDAVQQLRAGPPAELGGSAVVAVDDLALGSSRTTGVPATEGLRWTTASGARVVVRPSGTEPKLKCYLEVVRPVGRGGDVRTARAGARAALAALADDVRAVVPLPSPSPGSAAG